MKEQVIKSSLVRKMNVKDLRITATQLNIEVNHEDGFPKKKAHLLEDVLKILKKQRNQQGRMTINDQHYLIVDDPSINKSEKMRRLYDLDMPVKHITILTNSHYSFVHGVIQRYLQKKNQVKSIPQDDAQAQHTKQQNDCETPKTSEHA